MDHQDVFVGGTILVTLVTVVFSIAVTIVPLVLVFRWLAKAKAANQQLLTNGAAADARVVQMGPTGLTLNDAPQMNLTLQVHPPAHPGYRGHASPFTATVQAFVPLYAMGRVQPGATVPVRFDPADPRKLAVDFGRMGFA